MAPSCFGHHLRLLASFDVSEADVDPTDPEEYPSSPAKPPRDPLLEQNPLPDDMVNKPGPTEKSRPEIKTDDSPQPKTESKEKQPGETVWRPPPPVVPVERYHHAASGMPTVPPQLDGFEIIGHSRCQYVDLEHRTPGMDVACDESTAAVGNGGEVTAIPNQNSHCVWPDVFRSNPKGALTECRQRCEAAGEKCKCFTFADHPGVTTRCIGSDVRAASVHRVPLAQDSVVYMKPEPKKKGGTTVSKQSLPHASIIALAQCSLDAWQCDRWKRQPCGYKCSEKRRMLAFSRQWLHLEWASFL